MNEIIKLGFSKKQAQQIVDSMSIVDKSLALADTTFLQDVCKTPPIPEPISAPYPNIAKASDDINSKKVKANEKINLKDNSTVSSNGFDSINGSDEKGSLVNSESEDQIDGSGFKDILNKSNIRSKIKIGKIFADELKGATDFINGMGSQGYKVIAASLVIGLILGIGTNALFCGPRIRALNVELDELWSGIPGGDLDIDRGSSGDIFGHFEINGITWDYEGQRFRVEISNTGPTMTFIMSIAVKRFDSDEGFYSDLLGGSASSLATGSTRTFW